jgi:hypothetical protein
MIQVGFKTKNLHQTCLNIVEKKNKEIQIFMRKKNSFLSPLFFLLLALFNQPKIVALTTTIFLSKRRRKRKRHTPYF